MAITLTQAELSAAIRLGDSPEETAEATRLLGYVTAAVSRNILARPMRPRRKPILNEAAIRLAGYLFDMPNAGRGLSYANAGREIAARGRSYCPIVFTVPGATGEAVAAAQQAVGIAGNPVTDVAISGGNLVVTFNDGTTRDEPLPAGMTGDGTDQTARDAAAAAQSRADGAANAAANAAAQSDIDAHEANHPSGGDGVDQTARDAADGAQGRRTQRKPTSTRTRARRTTTTRHGPRYSSNSAERRRTRRKPSSTRTRARRTTRTARPERRRRRHRLAPMTPTLWPMERWTPAVPRRRRGTS